MPSAHVGRYPGWASMPPVEGHVPPGTFGVVAIHGARNRKDVRPSVAEDRPRTVRVTGRCLMSLVTEYLEARDVPYEVIHHDPSVSSLEEARAVHLDADHVLKAVVIATRSGRAVTVIPASRRLDIHLVREALADRSAYLATEDELQSEYPSDRAGRRPRARVAPGCRDARRSLRARTRHGRVRRSHPDGVRSGPDARSLPWRTRRLRSARGRTGDGRDERTMNGGQPDPIRRIVVGVDGSDGAARAVAWSARLARATGAEVVAAHAIESPAFLDGFPLVTGTIQNRVRGTSH